MTEEEIAAAAALLAEARRGGTIIERLPVTPGTVAEAHAIQDRVTALLGETVAAYKANVPAGAEPTRGVIYAGLIYPSPARIAPRRVPHLGVEGEVAFRFIRDLPPRDAAYAADEVGASVVALPAIEVVSGRFRDPRARPPLEQLADCIINGAFVPGAAMADWRHLDLPRLKVTLRVNGQTVLEQEASHPTGDPLGVAVALVNMMRGAGGVRAGQMVTTGSWTGLRFLEPGDACAVRFEGLGGAEVTFAD
ncbi:MAG TPA: fumarylacetoacetate hydrolase family protein [Acetobacteraceae bacterium]|nr:fumarylacetoacetate hydrolase family protein [Acetobacteraceae bacterium]